MAAAQDAISIDLASPAIAVVQALQDPSTRVLARLPLSLDYQRVVADRFVLALLLSVNDALTTSASSVGANDFAGLVVELDWHPFDTGMTGFYVGGQVYAQGGTSLSYLFAASDAERDRSLQFGLGAAVGYELPLPLNLLLNVAAGFGVGYNIAENTSSVVLANSIPSSGVVGTLTRLELSLGYRF
jgi:hypothetical protein